MRHARQDDAQHVIAAAQRPLDPCAERGVGVGVAHHGEATSEAQLIDEFCLGPVERRLHGERACRHADRVAGLGVAIGAGEQLADLECARHQQQLGSRSGVGPPWP
jgi:hypothetical protein